MPRAPRYYPAGIPHELTARTVWKQFLLRPSPTLDARILATLGRALALYPIEVHAFVVLSNHWHCLFTPRTAAAARDFARYVQAGLARAINDELGRQGPVWSRVEMTPVIGAEAETTRLRYVLAHGAKEGLVASPLDWPGVHAARALCGYETLVGQWLDRTRACRLRHGGGKGGGRDPLPSEVTTAYPITFTPLPSWRHLEAEQRVAHMRALVASIVVDARATHPRPKGVAAVLAQDPADRPAHSKHGRAPICHAADELERRAFKDARRSFIDAHRTAWRCMRIARPAHYPSHAFPAAAPPSTERITVTIVRGRPRPAPKVTPACNTPPA